VDFSTSVEIAALFARDRPSDASFPSPEACIYCYNSEELFAWFRRISRDEKVRLQLYPVDATFPQLHRLSAQHGVFMHAPAEWYESAPLHCILFDRGPPLDEIERSHLYPPTGRLEEQIRAFLHQAAHETWVHEASKLTNFRRVTLRPPPPDEMRECFASLTPQGNPPRIEDWPVAESGWTADSYRPPPSTAGEVPTRLSDTGKALLARNPLELMRRVRDPPFLFSFEKLRRCFVEYLIPMQLICGDDDTPMICSPAKLDYLGPP
jgi:hypothetical protein